MVNDLPPVGLVWNDADYAGLRLRLDLFDDYITAQRFEYGQPGALFLVDPLDLAARLADLTISTCLLPPNCLFWQRANGVERLAVAIPPAVWPVSIYGEKLTWRVPLPWLVFCGCGLNYQVFAFGGLLQPTDPGEKLYHAPVPNMGQNGVCRGSAPFPAAAAATINAAWDAFISSEFNSHLANGKSRAHPDNVLNQWRALHLAAEPEYPVADLVETKHTLKDLMDGKL
jgi:PRTRC genetic system protein B